ncbi:hypothetical protein [Methylobacterium gregans]|uniref:Uncharacterized protein n=1 Tax=Methylobacterium gregans TaxID=374424 RepID=A0AA37HRL2_9HYPH|nr:hypothetical protein [Methylobacterium gregans]MDQ0520150.1 hypothetical protein [Methylobacterium gregans]GJD80441.1 hypothetical protein NBEOAGPD_3682 [Methylobacterium gregans]GLS52553.1 hypothetical protein GCM10007886_07360 [Methylobacterium gregans]
MSRARALAEPPPGAPAETAPALPDADIASRLHAFRSLGGNCEFGFVQRYGGAEPSGLLRFSYTPLADLIHALDSDFTAFGAPDDLHLAEAESGTYYCASRRYGIWSNTAQAVGQVDPAALLEREYGRIAHLKRRMLAELRQGAKILVRKVGPEEDAADLDRLVRAIRRHGPSTLLRVAAAGPDWRPEPARWVADGVMEGHVRRFAPQEVAWDVDLEPWLLLCDSAERLHRGLPHDPGLPPARPVRTVRGPKPRLHATRGPDGISSFRQALDARGLARGPIHTVSAWIWLPADFAGTQVFAALDYERLAWAEADTARRECWQRVWVSARIREDRDGIRIGLVARAPRGQLFWSAGWRLAEGPLPPPEPAPAHPPPAGLGAWLARLRR